jgi:NAD(P)-dependent dehydrogenase (short-subunit alcohol dehydrogenase family)
MAGKVAVVTGAASGIGLETARAYAEAGARVVMIGRRAAELAAAADEIGEMAIPKPGDVTNTADIDRILDEVETELGHVDYLVTAAGLCVPGLLDNLTVDEFADHLNVNVTGSFYIALKLSRKMKARGSGSIVFVGSEQSHMGMGYYTAYATSKHAVLGMTRCFAAELASTGVRVNCICPGPVDTPMLESEIQWFGGGEDIRREAWERVPMKRLAKPAEIARSILFLADAKFATGTAMDVDGGTTVI